MKKFLILLLTLTIAIFCAGCGTFTPPIVTNPGNTGEGGNNTPIDPDIDPDAFTVVLLRESGARFYPDPDMNIKAAWTGQGESYSASFGANGIAAISGLDGTYNVSLTNVPEGYTFDPNGDYSVNNNHKSVPITLFVIADAPGDGTAFFANSNSYAKQITNTGLYRAEIKTPNQRVCYMFTPNQDGTYLIESLVNVQENAVNPVLDYYVANSAYINEANPTTFDTGGPSGSFTKNFRFYADRVAGFDGTWGLAIRASVQPGHSYPVYVDFRISYLRDSANNGVNVQASGPFADSKTGTPAGDFTYIYKGEANDKYIDGYKVKFNSKDGFYHVLPQSEYNKEDSAINWDNCPYLYARIFTNCDIIQGQFNKLHINSSEGLLWHREHYIDPNVIEHLPSGNTHNYDDGICHIGGQINLVLGTRTYYDFVHAYYRRLVMSSFNTLKTLGVVPVNEELKRFLDDFAKYMEFEFSVATPENPVHTAPLFDDGAGIAEQEGTNFGFSVSGPDSVWLFCCGYFGNTIAYSH